MHVCTYILPRSGSLCVCLPVVEAAVMRAISLLLGGHEVLEGNVSGSNSVSPFQLGPSLTALAAALTQIDPLPLPPLLLFFLFLFSLAGLDGFLIHVLSALPPTATFTSA